MLENHHNVLWSCFRCVQSTRRDFLEPKNGAVDPTTPLDLRERSIWKFSEEEKLRFLLLENTSYTTVVLLKGEKYHMQ